MAAACLHPLLSHASFWLLLNLDVEEVRKQRYLTTPDIQAFQAHFKSRGLPKLLSRTEYSPHPIHLYLRWLSEDSKLAEQVADAWNKVVERGDADDPECLCKKCARIGKSKERQEGT